MVEAISISFFAAFIGGIAITFFPCNYPLVLGYIALLVSREQQTSIAQALLSTLWFFVGFACTYTFFGGIAGLFGQFSQVALLFNQIKPLLVTTGSIFFIAIGLILLKVIALPKQLQRSRFASLPKTLSPTTPVGAVIIGAIFAVGWSPCVGPLLGGILVLAASSGSVLTGMALLIVFSFGMMVPLAVLTVLYAKSSRLLNIAERGTATMQMIGGLLFILIGFFFLFGGVSFMPYGEFLEGLERYV
ncbi:MAG: sulfite exporter TauE/SafE family protein [Candidatus Kaiserbacteria bacterium]|nr:sulfite exporter TauE/SafE family protein [Candidatus Kaiserbacteria bacterium]